ncbi:hypothetical protein N7493_001646 [Penicillium malachiteum]|uniref:Uncharacterized protein n=1 Tax=Penicillium malachiteum TaxID=1324776 RepID=A0AAD6HUT4_9EURO|nr:hypothetical protein N7493_001646 [Penicillium malachiteum]
MSGGPKKIIGLPKFADKLWNEEHVERSLDVILLAVSVHVSQAVALRSELFGPLGDEPVQIIDTDDHARLSRFEPLYEEDTSTKEPDVQHLFKVMKNQRFKHSGCEDEPTFAWLPVLSGGEVPVMNLDEHFPKSDNPWAMEAQKIIPKLRTKIMVRLCTKKCHLEPDGDDWRGYHLSDDEERFFQLEVRDIRSTSLF